MVDTPLIPSMGSVTLVAANTAYQLSALLGVTGNYAHVQYLAIQADPNSGGAKFWIGPPGISPTNCGVEIYATQVWPVWSAGANLVRLTHIYLMSDTDNVKMNIVYLQ